MVRPCALLHCRNMSVNRPRTTEARGDNLFCNHMIWDPNGLCDTYE